MDFHEIPNLPSKTIADNDLLIEGASKRRRLDIDLDYIEQANISTNNNEKQVLFQSSNSPTLLQPNEFYSRYSSSQLSPTSVTWIMESLFANEQSSGVNQDEQDTSSKCIQGVDNQANSILSNKVLLQNEIKHKSSEWSTEEDSKLFDLHRQHGNSWAVIANDLPGRSRLDVKTRYRSLCRAAKRFWSQKQDALLLNLYSQYRYMWNDAILLVFPTKTKSSVKNRLKDLLEQKNDINTFPPNSPSNLLLSRPEIQDELLKSTASFQLFSSSSFMPS